MCYRIQNYLIAIFCIVDFSFDKYENSIDDKMDITINMELPLLKFQRSYRVVFD